MRYAYTLPKPGEMRPEGKIRERLDFITEKQLLDTGLWEKFVSAFSTDADDIDLGWRGEYWGKMMRGACLVYRCTADERLYAVLEKAVTDLLACADSDGRISSYSRGLEFSGWDMWCRKYVLTGMLHFCDICKDPALVERIVESMKKHAARVIENIGGAPGQKEITSTSTFWLGVNSCTILEPILDLYSRTGEKELLDFARYIIGTGGVSGDGDLVALALEDRLAPFEYPETKAYETMSFFEGLLAYYEVTGEEKYLTAVKNFTEKVYETDITLIGCAGCTHELFDNSALRQADEKDGIMQETCVTVTWMRLCARLFLLTGDERYADRIRASALNALDGSVNLYDQPVTDLGSKKGLTGLPFDSYSPLYMNRRGRGVGGLKFFTDGSYYGCCVCIAAAGLAVYPLIESLRKEKSGEPVVRLHRLGDKIAFTFGPYALARDSVKEGADIRRPISLPDGEPEFETLPPEDGESVRVRLKTADGYILLTDYASCGKHWANTDGIISVWLPTA